MLYIKKLERDGRGCDILNFVTLTTLQLNAILVISIKCGKLLDSLATIVPNVKISLDIFVVDELLCRDPFLGRDFGHSLWDAQIYNNGLFFLFYVSSNAKGLELN